MSCKRTRQIIRDSFDRGWEVDLDDPHLRACKSCMAYSHEIHTLDKSLKGIGLEACREGLVNQIQARVAEERRSGVPAWQWLSWAAATVVVATGLAWQFPPDWTAIEIGLASVSEAILGKVWLPSELPLSEPASAAWEYTRSVFGSVQDLSGTVAGVAISALLISILLLNVGVAPRLPSSQKSENGTLAP